MAEGSSRFHSRPVLAEEFLRVTTPSGSNMRTPVPPHFQPPPPPFESPSSPDPLSTLATDEDDDSQYETPDRHAGSRIASTAHPTMPAHRDERSALISHHPFGPENSNPLVSNTMKNGNSYRHSPSLNIEEERHQLLKQNPQGGYFIPNSCRFFFHLK